ncbi:MAG TPA: cupin domain-containing protein [Caulobacteraceae bacterium]|nr:cupin domain-containing protein [Caulobacteraceae bacterium]
MQFNTMLKACLLVAAPLVSASVAAAQPAPPTAEQKAAAVAAWKSNWPAPVQPAASDPNKAYFPDPGHVPFILPQDIPWTGTPGKEQQFKMVGDPSKPGPYVLLLKWWPGNFSRPHFHGMPRFITVISGTWWVSTSNHFDPDKTYPFGPGTISQDVIDTVHWDGAKAGGDPVVLEIVGEGPVPNVNVDEDGKPTGKVNF